MRKDPVRDEAFWKSPAGQKRLSIAKAREAALEVKCYECGAPPQQPCRFPGGKPRKVMHTLRFEVAWE